MVSWVGEFVGSWSKMVDVMNGERFRDRTLMATTAQQNSYMFNHPSCTPACTCAAGLGNSCQKLANFGDITGRNQIYNGRITLGSARVLSILLNWSLTNGYRVVTHPIAKIR